MSSLSNELALPIDISDEQASDTVDSHPGDTRSKVHHQNTDASLNAVELGTLTQMLAISKDCMAAIDRHGNYVYINAAMREFCDFSDAGILNQPTDKQQRLTEIKRLVLNNLESCMNGESKTETTPINEFDGTEGILTIHLVPSSSADDFCEHWIFSVAPLHFTIKTTENWYSTKPTKTFTVFSAMN